MSAVPYFIGVDGGGTKTEFILLDSEGRTLSQIVWRGANPSVVGAEQARETLVQGLDSIVKSAAIPVEGIKHTLLCMAGSPGIWTAIVSELTGFGKITATDDSLPVLELATGGGPGIAIHAGTGSFVAVRTDDGKTHYTGGLGWRFGDPGSGYDIGRRSIGRALAEMQGWVKTSGLSTELCTYTKLQDGPAITRFLYQHSTANAQIAGFAVHVIALAAKGDVVAKEIVHASVNELLGHAETVGQSLFFENKGSIKAGVSGHILNTPWIFDHIRTRGSLDISPILLAPIEGVKKLLLREFASMS